MREVIETALLITVLIVRMARPSYDVSLLIGLLPTGVSLRSVISEYDGLRGHVFGVGVQYDVMTLNKVNTPASGYHAANKINDKQKIKTAKYYGNRERYVSKFVKTFPHFSRCQRCLTESICGTGACLRLEWKSDEWCDCECGEMACGQ